MSQRYKQLADGQLADFGRRRTQRIRCCDCGLVHIFRFYVSKTGRIRVRAWRDNRATAATRSTWKTFKIVK